MKSQYKQLFFGIVCALLAIPVSEYSIFFSGFILGAACIFITKIGYQALIKRSN